MEYSSLFTHPLQPPINRAFGEVKSRLNSSPLFTQVSATTHKGGIRQIQIPSLLFMLEFDEQISLSLLDLREIWTIFCHHLWWYVFFIILHTIIIFFKMFPYGWREVKSGEEWWRVAGPLHLAKRPVYRGFRGMGEEWRVLFFLKWNTITDVPKSSRRKTK